MFANSGGAGYGSLLLANGSAILTVKDTGQGIAAEALPHIFERFYRVDPSRTHGAGHSGLGLAISSTLAETLGGAITVESKVGEGSRFSLWLPRRAPEE